MTLFNLQRPLGHPLPPPSNHSSVSPSVFPYAMCPGDDLCQMLVEQFQLTFLSRKVILITEEDGRLLNLPSRNRVPLPPAGYWASSAVPIFVETREGRSFKRVTSRSGS
jgi:hypothetical protein